MLYKLVKGMVYFKCSSCYYILVSEGGGVLSKTQMLKGVLEGCVLQIVAQHETYGYQLVQELRAVGFTDVIGGTIYPILQKLEKKALISGRMKPSPEGPRRKYFSITPDGKAELTAFLQDWQEINNNVKRIFKLGGKE